MFLPRKFINRLARIKYNYFGSTSKYFNVFACMNYQYKQHHSLQIAFSPCCLPSLLAQGASVISDTKPLWSSDTNIIIFTSIMAVRSRPEEAISNSRITQYSDGRQEHKWADCAWFAFQEKTCKIEHHKHYMIMQKTCWNWLGDQQDRDQPL